MLFDADKDGWLDMGITSPNHPRFRIVRNEIGKSQCSSNNSVDVVLVGGQEDSGSSSEWSPRDPYGATVKVSCGDETRVFQLCGGQGLSTVNAKRIHVGMGSKQTIDKLEVTWTSGKTTVRENVEAKGRIEIREREQ